MVELIMVVFILGLVFAVVYSSLDTFVRTSATTQIKSVTLADARTALERVARNVRAAQAPLQGYSVGSPDPTSTSISMFVHCTGGLNCDTTTSTRRVAYLLGSDALTVTLGLAPAAVTTRTLLGPSGPTAVPAAQRPGAVKTSGTPASSFRYFDKNGQEIIGSAVIPCPTGGPITMTESQRRAFDTHTIAIRLVVVAEPRRPNNTIDISTTVRLRNYREASPCP